MTPAPRILVLGIGNADGGDDAVGVLAARAVHALHVPMLTVQESGGEGADVMRRWRNVDVAILIDAMRADLAPGSVRRFEAPDSLLPAALLARRSTHAFGVADAIALGGALKQLPSRLIVYGIEGRRFKAGARMSPAVARAIPEVVEQVREEVVALA